MKYEQKNPVPLPAAGAFEEVPSSFVSTFDWQYALEREPLLALYEKGKARTWNASEIDWSIDFFFPRDFGNPVDIISGFLEFFGIEALEEHAF